MVVVVTVISFGSSAFGAGKLSNNSNKDFPFAGASVLGCSFGFSKTVLSRASIAVSSFDSTLVLGGRVGKLGFSGSFSFVSVGETELLSGMAIGCVG